MIENGRLDYISAAAMHLTWEMISKYLINLLYLEIVMLY